jgi:hypothetical protein
MTYWVAWPAQRRGLREPLEAFGLSGLRGRRMRLPVEQECQMFHVEPSWASRPLGTDSPMSDRRACERAGPRTHAMSPCNLTLSARRGVGTRRRQLLLSFEFAIVQAKPKGVG